MAVLAPNEIKAIKPTTRVLELGCGQVKRVPHAVAVDINPRSVADVFHDLNAIPYPFPDNEFDVVIAEHVLEHLDNVVIVVEELNRILKPGGKLYVEVPHFSSWTHFTDPTHRHAFSTASFDYFVPGEPLAGFQYSTARFRKTRVKLNTQEPASGFRRAINQLANRYPTRFERHWAFIFPCASINFELEVVK